MATFDSTHQIGVSTLSRKFLTIDDEVRRWRIKNSKIRDVFASALGISGDTRKWRAPLYSPHRIGVFTLWTDVLTLD